VTEQERGNLRHWLPAIERGDIQVARGAEASAFAAVRGTDLFLGPAWLVGVRVAPKHDRSNPVGPDDH